MEELEAEKAAREEEKVRYLGEKLPPLQLSGLNTDDLQVRVTENSQRGSSIALRLTTQESTKNSKGILF